MEGWGELKELESDDYGGYVRGVGGLRNGYKVFMGRELMDGM